MKNKNIDFDVYHLFREYPDSRNFDIMYDGAYTFEPSEHLQFPEDFDPSKDTPCGISREIFDIFEDEKDYFYVFGDEELGCSWKSSFIFEIIEAYRDFKKYIKEFEKFKIEESDFTRYYETSMGIMGIRNYPYSGGFVYLTEEEEYI